MDNHSSDNITQKDLLKLLFDQAQHNATREELNALEGRMSERFKQADERMDKLEEKFDKKFDRMNWLLVTSLVGICATLALQILK